MRHRVVTLRCETGLVCDAMELDVLSDGIESSTALPSYYLYPTSRQALSLDLSMDDDRGGAVDAGVDRYEVGHD